MSGIEVGSRWRHFACADTDRFDVVVLAVVEHYGLAWVVYGEEVRSLASLPPLASSLEEFTAKYSEVAAGGEL